MADADPIGQKADDELACQARAGSPRSFEELARRYKRRLFVYLRPRLRSDEDAEDLVQETFLKLYRNIASYDPAFRFSSWLYTSASRLAISSFRKKRLETRNFSEEEAGSLADTGPGPGGQEKGMGLWDAARTLGGNQFQALWLRYGEDMTVEEVAGVLGKSRLAVRLLLHRARTNLVKRVGPAPAGATVARKAKAVRNSSPG